MGHPAASSGPTFGGAESVPSLAASSVVCFYFRIDLFQYLPGWAAISLASIPIGLLFYGLTEQSWQTALKFTVGVPVGTGLPVVLGSLDLAFLPYYHSTSATIRVRGNDRLSTHKRGRQ